MQGIFGERKRGFTNNADGGCLAMELSTCFKISVQFRVFIQQRAWAHRRIIYKWKNEMKGDVGCQVMKKKANKKMYTPRQKVIYNPIPASLLC